jgi:hypothetical protein
MLPDLLRYAVFSLFVLFQCHRLFVTHCSCLDMFLFRLGRLRWFGFDWLESIRVGGRFVRLFMHAMFCHRWFWYANLCSCWPSVYSLFHTSTNAYTSLFFYIWFRARTLLRWVVFDVSVFALIFSPVRVGSKTTSNWN